MDVIGNGNSVSTTTNNDEQNADNIPTPTKQGPFPCRHLLRFILVSLSLSLSQLFLPRLLLIRADLVVLSIVVAFAMVLCVLQCSDCC